MPQEAARRWEPPSDDRPSDLEKTHAFLGELTALSRKYGVGINGEAVLFLLQTDSESDYETAYTIDGESRLLFE